MDQLCDINIYERIYCFYFQKCLECRQYSQSIFNKLVKNLWDMAHLKNKCYIPKQEPEQVRTVLLHLGKYDIVELHGI